MRHLPLTFALALLAPLFSLHARVVTVNIDKIFAEYQQTKLADQELQRRIEEFRRQQADSVSLYQASQQDFNRFREEGAKIGLSEEERRVVAEKAAETITKLRTMEQELQQAQQTFQRDVEEQGRRLRQRIVDEIRQRIAELAKERGWLVVIDVSATGVNGIPVVPFSAPETDVTPEIIQSLNSLPVAKPEPVAAP